MIRITMIITIQSIITVQPGNSSRATPAAAPPAPTEPGLRKAARICATAPPSRQSLRLSYIILD